MLTKGTRASLLPTFLPYEMTCCNDGHGHGRPEAGDAGGNDLSALQSFVLVATYVFFFSFFA